MFNSGIGGYAMILKAMARHRKTGNMEWFYDIFTDGDSIMIDTKHRGFQPLKEPIELWVSLGGERDFKCVYAKEQWVNIMPCKDQQ